jgi:hypothetical protein
LNGFWWPLIFSICYMLICWLLLMPFYYSMYVVHFIAMAFNQICSWLMVSGPGSFRYCNWCMVW